MKIFEITDDSGFIGIINADRYKSFVNEDWGFDQLITHFLQQINENNLLLWGSGGEGEYRVGMNVEENESSGSREVCGYIEVTGNRLYLINYESLTMGAQFQDIELPESHMKNCFVELENGIYHCRIGQLKPESCNVDFIVSLRSINDTDMKNCWSEVPWR